MLINSKTRLDCPGRCFGGMFLDGFFKNKNFIDFPTILIMKNLTFFTLIISTSNQTPRNPNIGRGNPFERVRPRSRRKRPMTPWEAEEQFSGRPGPKPKRKIDESEILGEGFSGLEALKKEALKEEALKNDVLPFDYIEDEAEKTLQTVEIPDEIAALDKEEAAKPKPEGRRKRGRVVGGTDVLSEEEFPFYASLRNSASPNCGATILGKLPTITPSTYALSLSNPIQICSTLFMHTFRFKTHINCCSL